MEHSRFDQATQVLSNAARSRRTALGTVLTAALGGTVGGVMAPASGFAKRKKHRKKMKPTRHPAFECGGPTNGETQLGSDGRAGQVFTAARSGTLRQVRVGIIKDSTSVPGDYLVQRLTASDPPLIPHNSPVAVIAAEIISDGSVEETLSTLVANFSGPELVQGTAYAVVVNRQGSTTFKVQTLLSNVCSGALTFSLGADSFTVDTNADAMVSVLVD